MACRAAFFPTVGSFFTDKNNKLAKSSKTIDMLDKICKTLDPTIESIGHAARGAGASPETLREIGKAREIVKTTRDVAGFLNVFGSSIPSCVDACKTSIELTKGLYHNKQEVVLRKPQTPKPINTKELKFTTKDGQQGELRNVQFTIAPTSKYNEKAVGAREMRWALGSSVSAIFATAAVSFAFAFNKPVLAIERLRGQKFSSTTSKFGTGFFHLMTISHGAGLIGAAFGIGYEIAAFDRGYSAAKTIKAKDEVYAEFTKKMVEHSVNIGKNTLELGLDVIKLGQYSAPPAVRCPIAILVGLIGIWQAWQKVV